MLVMTKANDYCLPGTELKHLQSSYEERTMITPIER